MDQSDLILTITLIAMGLIFVGFFTVMCWEMWRTTRFDEYRDNDHFYDDDDSEDPP